MKRKGFLDKNDESNLADFIWTVESELYRFPRNFGGLIPCVYNDDTIGVDSLWLTYPDKKAKEKFILTLPNLEERVEYKNLDEEKALSDFARIAQNRFYEIQDIIKKEIGLGEVYKIPAPVPGKNETLTLFKFTRKPKEIARQLALFFLYQRTFNNIHIKPENIFHGGNVEDTPYYLESIKQGYELADEWYKGFISENGNEKTKALECIDIEKRFLPDT